LGIQERKEREKEQRKQDIVDAAEKVFFSKGVKNATMDDVAEAAELSKGTLYLYFKNKEELYFAINYRGLCILIDLFNKAFEDGKNGLEKTFLIGKAFLQFSREHADYFNALTYYEVEGVDFSESDSVVCLCDQAGNEAIGILVEAIRTGIQDGSIRTDLDPEKTALILWGMTSGMIQLVAQKGPHLQERHGFPMNAIVDEAFRLMRCILEKK
jgi:TetR/AcrR family transcriptional regulator